MRLWHSTEARWSAPQGSAARSLALLGAAAMALGFWACNVAEPGGDTGGLGGALGLGGSPGCPRALGVVLSDYASTQVALVDADGKVESESVISTASSETDGLAFALSGDVVLPGTRPESGRLVLLDRFGTNVITFVDPSSGRVLDQLPVGTGFESNPHDYLELGGKAFVARFGQNTDPGREPFDDGGDLLILDAFPPRIRGQVLMPAWDELPSRATALAPVAGAIVVTLARLALDFRTTGAAALVEVSVEDESVTATFDLSPYQNCSRATLSPGADVFVVVCSGGLDQSGQVNHLERSGILTFAATTGAFTLLDELPATELGQGALQPDAAFLSENLLLVKTQTELGGDANNRLLAVDLAHRSATILLEAAASESGRGQGVVYGGLHCPESCQAPCLLADADQRVLQRVRLASDGEPELLSPVRVEDRVGLPPIALSPL